MARYKINTLLSLAFFVAINCRATNQTVGKPCHRSFFATKKAPHVIPEASIPFLPTISDKAANLIEPSRIPSLSDQLSSRQLRIRFNVPQYERTWNHFS